MKMTGDNKGTTKTRGQTGMPWTTMEIITDNKQLVMANNKQPQTTKGWWGTTIATTTNAPLPQAQQATGHRVVMAGTARKG
jgi:hypothetical protein